MDRTRQVFETATYAQSCKQLTNASIKPIVPMHANLQGQSFTSTPLDVSRATSADVLAQFERHRKPTIAAPQTIGLPSLFASARRALGFHEHHTPGYDEPTHVYATEPAVAGAFRLSDVFPAPSGDQLRELDSQSTQRVPAGVTQTMSHVVMNASRVLQAGARLLPIADAPPAVQDGDVIAWHKRAARFEVVTPAAFAIVADGDDAATSPLPLAGAEINLGDAASHAVSFTLTRREQKDRSDADAEFIVARALSLGLAQLCDRVLLEAIVASTPSAFTLGKAAAQGLRFDELKAICGTSAQGATVGAAGDLRVSGIGADLTDVIAPSIVGAFGRAAVAVNDEIRIVIKRTSIRGDMEITVFVTLEALLPTSDFWVAA
ncbi:hypothetical protein [Variovorax sp. Sphag1AA]|uniref:hypothetical protein n=1 Tax=Variovorax sp. Sphag1AA TaxID=2587027 RepID=UPI001607C659|nr:hypothetical protein [Variovorax sp. Sphag1AA]MBB3176250.1 hypothetical protein [Variovorax sp. Sphag1AA]